jgi:hypothetical protein
VGRAEEEEEEEEEEAVPECLELSALNRSL